MVQPAGGPRGGAEAVGMQHDVLQLWVQVSDSSGVAAEWFDGVN